MIYIPDEVIEYLFCSKFGFFNISLYISNKVLFNYNFFLINVDKTLYISS